MGTGEDSREHGPDIADRVAHALSGFDVFVSYSRRQSHYAFRIAQQLADAGVETFLDQLAAKPGRKVPRDVTRALFRSRMMLVLISEHSLASENVQREIHLFAKTKGSIVFLTPEELRSPLTRFDESPSTTLAEDAGAFAKGTPTPEVLVRIRAAVARPLAAWRDRLLLGFGAALVAFAAWSGVTARDAQAGANERERTFKAQSGSTQRRVESARQARARFRNDATQAEQLEAGERAKEAEAHLSIDRDRDAMRRLASVLNRAPTGWGEPQHAQPSSFTKCFAGGRLHEFRPVGDRSNLKVFFILGKDNYVYGADKEPFVIKYQGSVSSDPWYVVSLFADRAAEIERAEFARPGLPDCAVLPLRPHSR